MNHGANRTKLVSARRSSKTREGEEPVEIPDYLIEQYAKSLFVTRHSRQSHHPLDDFYRYAKKFKVFRIGKDGIQATVDDEKDRDR